MAEGAAALAAAPRPPRRPAADGHGRRARSPRHAAAPRRRRPAWPTSTSPRGERCRCDPAGGGPVDCDAPRRRCAGLRRRPLPSEGPLSAYRTYEQQAQLYDLYLVGPGRAGEPARARSTHELGPRGRPGDPGDALGDRRDRPDVRLVRARTRTSGGTSSTGAERGGQGRPSAIGPIASPRMAEPEPAAGASGEAEALAVAFEGATKRYAGTDGPAVDEPHPRGRGRRDLRPRRARRDAARRPRCGWSTAWSRSPRATSSSAAPRCASANARRAAARDRLRDPADRAVPAPDDRREHRHRSRRCWAGTASARGPGRRADRADRARPRARRSLPLPALRRPAAAGRRRPGPGRRSRA